MPLPTIDPHEIRVEVEERHVRSMLTRSIADGTLRPGERLQLVDVGRWLGVGAASARRAVEHLAGAGVVETDGTAVRIPDQRAG